MKHTYQITGMTCANCEAKVKSALLMLPDVTSAEVSRETGTATITMTKHITLSELQKAIGEKGNYKITLNGSAEETPLSFGEGSGVRYWLETYKPILLIFTYITSITLLVQFTNHHFMPMQWMQHFMAGFFLTFSFFKLLNLDYT